MPAILSSPPWLTARGKTRTGRRSERKRRDTRYPPRMDLGLRGRVAMVAAASKGIGRAVARSLVREGCPVSICSRNPAHLAEAKRHIEDGSSDALVLAIPADVSRAEDLKDWYAATLEAFGRVEILVTNTGGPPAARSLQATAEQWSAHIE